PHTTLREKVRGKGWGGGRFRRRLEVVCLDTTLAAALVLSKDWAIRFEDGAGWPRRPCRSSRRCGSDGFQPHRKEEWHTQGGHRRGLCSQLSDGRRIRRAPWRSVPID